VPLARQSDLANSDLVFRVVSRDNRNAYVVVVSDERPSEIPGQAVELDPRPLSELRRRLENLEERWDELQYERVGLTRWGDLLSLSLDAACDAADRAWASSYTLNDQRVFALQAWIPSDQVNQIRTFAARQKLAVTIDSPEADDEPPTLLRNAEPLAGSESLVTFYKTPRYRSWDPSIISFVSFAIFFSMIVADAGYGLLLLLLTGLLWKKIGSSPTGRRMRGVLLTIDLCTIGYGVICGSYFGVSPADGAWLARLQVLDAKSQSQMMPITIGIGVIHLSLAHLINAWLQRGTATALSSIGWVCVMLGAALAGVGVLANVEEGLALQLKQIGEFLLFGGLAAVLLFSSQRPVFSLSLKNHALRLLDGLKGLTNLSGLFGDALSYLRLFALGLASAKLSETFNGLGASAWNQAGFGVVAAIFIVLLGHTLNLALSIMSGVVHGLRLNCIEFYKWGLPDEGYSFKTFEKRVKEA
jgi:V/A-type H+-transporting ATPase subunit I